MFTQDLLLLINQSVTLIQILHFSLPFGTCLFSFVLMVCCYFPLCFAILLCKLIHSVPNTFCNIPTALPLSFALLLFLLRSFLLSASIPSLLCVLFLTLTTSFAFLHFLLVFAQPFFFNTNHCHNTLLWVKFFILI